MPMAEEKQALSVPLGILNKGPEYFRQQAIRNQRRQGKSAAQQLAESRSQFLSWDPAHRQLNDNSNNHSCDSQRYRADLVPAPKRTVSPLVRTDDVIKQDRTIEFEKREGRRGRDRNLDNRRSRKRTKDRRNDVNGNSNKPVVCEKALLDSPEHDANLKDAGTPKAIENEGEASNATDDDKIQNRRSRSENRSRNSPRPSVKEMVSKIGSEKSDKRTDDVNASGSHSGRDRPRKHFNFVSSESSETSPVLPRRGEYFSRNARPAPVRDRERARPSPESKEKSKSVSQKSPAGSHVQNVLHVLHQQASTSSSSYDQTPRRSVKKRGARFRGKSCPPTGRSKPSLAELLAKDAEGARPRSKDLNDLDTLASTESDDSNFVKARIRSFQSPVSQDKKSLSKTLLTKLSNATSDEHMLSVDDGSSHSLSKRMYNVERKKSSTTPSDQYLNSSFNSDSPGPIQDKGQLKDKGPKLMHSDAAELYSLPSKSNKQTIAHRRHPSSSDISYGSVSSDNVETSITPLSKKPLFKSKSADVGPRIKEDHSRSSAPTSDKPALPRKPDFSVILKRTRLSYHVYEEVTNPDQGTLQNSNPELAVAMKDNVFENPAHFSDPDEPSEIVQDAAKPSENIFPTRPDNVAIVVEGGAEEKEDIKPTFFSFSSHMKKLKGILLREKDQPVSEEQGSTETGTKVKIQDEQFRQCSKENKKSNVQSPSQRKLAAQLGLECKEKATELKSSSYNDMLEEVLPFGGGGELTESLGGDVGVKNVEVTDNEPKNAKLMLPVHAKSSSWDELNKKKKLKTSLSDNIATATSTNVDKTSMEKSLGHTTSNPVPFQMPHDKQKQELSKKLELFLKQSKAYNTPGNSPTKLKKKVSFDASGVTENTEKSSEKQPLIRKVSITPLNQNYDEVEYNSDFQKDLVEETIIIDSSNSIRLASPRSKDNPSDTGVAQNKIQKINEDSCEEVEDDRFRNGSKEAADVEMVVEVYDDAMKPRGEEQSSNDNKRGARGHFKKDSKLVDFRKASVSTDLDTSPTHDYRGAHPDVPSDAKPRSYGEYDTSSRSDDCGLGATRGRVKHLKPYNARPFRNKNFSSDEDFIPEEHTRKSFWQTKAQLDIPQRQPTNQQAVEQHTESQQSASSGDADMSLQSSSIRRSKSEPSTATSADNLDQFFDRMGLDDSVLEVVSKPHIYDEDAVFHEMHVWKTRGNRGSESDDSNTSYAMSETSNVSEEGVMNLRKFTKQLPDQSMSIVTKNARVIKWMCQCKKARNHSVS